MSLTTDIRDTAARAELEICKMRGVQATYTPFVTGGTPVVVWARPLPGESTDEGDVASITTEQSVRRFRIPRQTGFPPSNGVRTKGTLTYDGVLYRIAGFSVDSVGARYTFGCIRDHAAVIGDR